MAGRAWTNHEVAYLRKYYGSIPAYQIGATLNRSRDAVVIAASRYNVAQRGYIKGSAADHNHIAVLVSRGKTASEIGGEIGLHKRTVSWHIEAMPKWVQEKAAKNAKKASARGRILAQQTKVAA